MSRPVYQILGCWYFLELSHQNNFNEHPQHRVSKRTSEFSVPSLPLIWCFSFNQFLAPLAVGQRAYVVDCCPSCVRPCVRLCINFFSKHFLLWNYLSVLRVPRGSVVKCLTRNPGVLGSSLTGSSGFFRGSVLGQDTSEPSLVLVKPRKA